MLTAHVSTDGCEALSAIPRICNQIEILHRYRKFEKKIRISNLIPLLGTKFRADSEFDNENCRCLRLHCEIFQNRKLISIVAKSNIFIADFSNNSQQTKMIFCTKIITILVSKCPRETAEKVWEFFATNYCFRFFGRHGSQLPNLAPRFLGSSERFTSQNKTAWCYQYWLGRVLKWLVGMG